MKFQKSSLSRLASYLLVLSVAFFVSACGDSNTDEFVINNPGNPALAGRYLGANDLSGGQTANLDLTVASNGNATGTWTVIDPVTAQTINAGSYAVSGAVNLATGNFSLWGTIPGVGNFSIAGTLPTAGNVASYSVSINGQTFAGVIQPAAQGQPNPPSGGGGGGGNSQLIQGGTLSNFVFTPDNNYNGDNPPIDAESGINGAVGEGVDGSESASIVISDIFLTNPVQTRTFAISIVVPEGEDLEVGTVYPLADNTGRGVIIALTDSEGVEAVEGWSLTASTTGSATITALNEDSITIEFTFSNVGPNSEIANNPATGTFNTSGTVVGNFAQIP